MAYPVRVVIADDHRLFREGIRLILAEATDVEVVGEAVDGRQTIDVVSDLAPDVVLLDITMPVMGGIEVIPAIRERSPETKPLMLTATMDEGTIFRALKAGAKGYLSKDADPADIPRAIQAVHRGEVWIERKLMARFIDREIRGDFEGGVRADATKVDLTPREREVLRCLARGWTNKEIASDLYISEKTVKSHLSNIFKKLNVSGRFQAMLHAVTLSLK